MRSIKSFEYRGVMVDILKPKRRGLSAKVKPPYEFRIHLKGLYSPFTGTKNCETAESSEDEARRVLDYYAEFHPEMM